MKLQSIVYVSHRYHTNQIPIMKGWREKGVEVSFFAQYQGVIEEHDYVNYFKMKPSLLTLFINWIIDICYNPSKAESLKNKFFIPSLFDVIRIIRKTKPQLVIIRNLSIGNAVVSVASKLCGVKYLIGYTQTPLYRNSYPKNKLKNIVKTIFPNCIYTPVLYRGKDLVIKMVSDNWYDPRYYVPLVCTPSIKEKTYINNNVIHLLDVGKYREYKNHFFLIDAFNKVKDKDKFQLRIIGQLSQSSEKEYYDRLNKYINELGLSSQIEVLGDVAFDEMNKIYEEADVLILPSKKESAGMVILEAMAQGLLVMSSNGCGLSCYLKENDCGFVFDIDSTDQLTSQLDYLSNKPSIIAEFGDKAKEAVKNCYSFDNYYKNLNSLLSDAYNIQLTI